MKTLKWVEVPNCDLCGATGLNEAYDSPVNGIVMGDEDAETADGCYVEPDGKCPHGYRSPLLVRGIM
jgi:hypothetical protein